MLNDHSTIVYFYEILRIQMNWQISPQGRNLRKVDALLSFGFIVIALKMTRAYSFFICISILMRFV